MRAIHKDFSDYPKSLTDDTRQQAHNQNIRVKKHVSGTHYNAAGVKEKHKKIYHAKCAFCEDDLSNSDKHTEHYRPKDEYYWLAHSWDNLLLACGNCNRKKSTKFEISNKEKARFSDYQHLSLEQLQNVGYQLYAHELPLLVNPEKEPQQFFDKHISFTFDGTIHSNNERMKYTIETCKLNREGLVHKRLIEINRIRNQIKLRAEDYRIHKDIQTFVRDIALVQRDFQQTVKNEVPFSALMKFIKLNFNELMKSDKLI